MVYSLVSNEPTVVMNVSWEIFSYYHVSSTEAEPGGHQFKEVETTVTMDDNAQHRHLSPRNR